MVASPLGNNYQLPTVSIPSWMTDKVIQDCISELNGMQALIMEDFVQARSTIDTAISILEIIGKLFLMARKGQWRKVRRFLRGLGHRPARKLANGWLMYYYGIRPLVGTLDAVLRGYGPSYKLKSAKRRVSTPADQTAFVEGFTSSVEYTGKAEYHAECKLWVRADMASDVAKWNALGLNWSNSTDLDALILAWALTPYSFVVDWFLPVERFLSTRRWASGLTYKYGYVSKLLTADITATQTNTMTGAPDSGVHPKVQLRCMQFQRIAYNTYSPPSGLSLNLALTPTRSINALALMIQRR